MTTIQCSKFILSVKHCLTTCAPPKVPCMWVGGALTFGESLFKAFPIDMPQDVVRLPVQVSEGQLTEELITGRHRKTQSCRSVLHIHGTHWQSQHCMAKLVMTAGASFCKTTDRNIHGEIQKKEKLILTAVWSWARYVVHTGCS